MAGTVNLAKARKAAAKAAARPQADANAVKFGRTAAQKRAEAGAKARAAAQLDGVKRP